jgi:hypothetical protein
LEKRPGRLAHFPTGHPPESPVWFAFSFPPCRIASTAPKSANLRAADSRIRPSFADFGPVITIATRHVPLDLPFQGDGDSHEHSDADIDDEVKDFHSLSHL